MFTTTIAILSATVFLATILHVNSARKEQTINISELWKIRGYQEDDARLASRRDKPSLKPSSKAKL